MFRGQQAQTTFVFDALRVRCDYYNCILCSFGGAIQSPGCHSQNLYWNINMALPSVRLYKSKSTRQMPNLKMLHTF